MHRATIGLKGIFMTRFLTSLTFLLAFGAAPAWANCVTMKPLDFGPKEKLSIQSKDKTHIFDVEVADTDEEQNRGMMCRDGMADTDGMLFEFDKPKVATIWMKNTAIPLDILFVRPNGKVLKIEHGAKPYSLRLSSSEAQVAAVVELRGGRARELGIRPGDVVAHDFFKTN